MSEMNKTEYLKRLLSFSAGDDAEGAAQRITDAFLDPIDIANADEYAFMTYAQCSEQTAFFMRLVSALSARRITDKYKNGKKYLQSEIETYIFGLLFGLPIEAIYMISLDDSGKVVSTDLLAEGTINSSVFLPRKMLDIALRKNSKKVILAHNHPGGTPVPSDNDINVTMLAHSILSNAKIGLAAHYIVAGFQIYDFYSEMNQIPDDLRKFPKVKI